MYAVIFTATMNTIDAEYSSTAEKMRALAFTKYGCKDFTSCTEGNNEIAISYWKSKDQIRAWKNDPEHKAAQELGAKKWYKSYKVQVVELLREYESST
ncbi:MAG: antibiotic biosynthesis monooxygenase [SAR86 cluster bacterium]|uniref:Antibiotic biosynthesis monooxygenase n=1 Tax=SAR86 cluster bacterium TaxID=2030880 RepID=A0A2A5CIP1_9GAMM|nr:MAG: antibiotic biosynthesis monooxygenase [SAR86 cluster bacterium]